MKNLVAGRWFDLMLPLLAMLGALALGAILLLFLGVNPLVAYGSMISGAFGNKNGLADVLVVATPLLLVALGVTIAFRANVINIGGEGQLVMGALATTWLAVAVGERLAGWLLILLGLLIGTLAGGLWGALAGALKARLKVNEILSTIMLNQIAAQLGLYLLRGPLMDPEQLAAGTNLPHSARLPKVADMLRLADIGKALGLPSAKAAGIGGYLGQVYGLLAEPTRLHIGLLLALLMAGLVYLFLWRTTVGYRIRAVGLNPDAARYAGMAVEGTMVLSMFLSGALVGLAGAVEILGLHHRMFEPPSVSAGYGFSGIVVALFGKLHPLGAIPSAILFGGLLVGGDKMQRAVQVPQVLVTALLGLIVLFVVRSELWARRRANRRQVGLEK
jgi:simple sugar transport system permease protein